MAANRKWLRGIPPSRAAKLFTFFVLAMALQVPPASAANDAVITASSGVAYVSGGAGTESIDRLRSMEGNFTVKLVFARDTGEYLADVEVIVTDAASRVQLATVSDGPWLLARLPPGTYQISASHDGRTKSRRVVVGENALRTVDFRWPAD